MAIVKMKKLRVMAMADHRDELLKGLLHLGCVEISEPDDKLADPAWSALLKRGTSRLAETKSEITEVNTALDAIKRFAQPKDGLFAPRGTVSEQEFLSEESAQRAQEVSSRIGGTLQDLTRLQGEETRLLSRKASLQPWVSLDMPLEREGTAHTVFRTGVCPASTDTGAVKTELAAADTAAELYEISADKQQKYYLVICHRQDEEAVMEVLRPHNFSVTTFQNVTGTAAENVAELDRQLAKNHTEQEAATAAIRQSVDDRAALRMYADRLTAEAAKDTNAERILTDGTILFFEGWAPAENIKEVESFLERSGCAWETSDPTEEEYPKVPVKLKNNWFTQPLNMVTNMYVMPAYDGLDPNPLMAPFFITFYGLMMADMAYGILMILGAWVMLKKMHAKGGMKDFGGLLGLCGTSTFIWGAMTGGFFGDFIPQLLKIINPESTFQLPYLFTPLTDTLMILVGSLVLGLIQIFTGMAISVVKKFKDGNWQDAVWEEFTWWTILIGAALAILGIGSVGGYPMVLIVGLLMLVYGSTRNSKGIGKLFSLIGAVYNGVTGYFSDTLSYARLMALMLAGSVIAQVFNTLGAVTGNVIGFVIVSLIGNMLNFALNLLGCYVHDLRLQCLEFFNRFYKEGGKPFRPLDIQTKYVDVIEQK